MDDAGGRRHIEDDILDRAGLRDGPVNTRASSRWRNACGVDDKVPNLFVENIYRYPVQVGRSVRVAINQTEASETG